MGTVTPGWFSDPAREGTQRYWDGDAWTGWVVDGDAPMRWVEPSAVVADRLGLPALPAQADGSPRGRAPSGAFAAVLVVLAVLGNVLFVADANLMTLGEPSYRFDDTPIGGLWAWVVAVNLVFAVGILFFSGRLSVGPVVIAVVVVAVVGVPVALAARAGLPENPIAGFEATLDAMERAMPWLGSPIVAEVQERCTFMLDDSENAFVKRVYPVGDVDRDAAMDRVARYLRRHGSIRVG